MKKLLKQIIFLSLTVAALMTFAAAAETKTLQYDDRWDVSGQEVEIIEGHLGRWLSYDLNVSVCYINMSMLLL